VVRVINSNKAIRKLAKVMEKYQIEIIPVSNIYGDVKLELWVDGAHITDLKVDETGFITHLEVTPW